MYDAILSETVTIAGANGDQIEAYLARPLDSAPRGGVVVIHHIPGYDEGSLEITRRFAAHGYNAICPNLFWRYGAGLGAAEGAAAAREAGGVPDEQFAGDATGAAAVLRGLSNANGKVGAIGFCSGGRQSIIAACDVPIDAAVDCYGALVVGESIPQLPPTMQPIPHRIPDVKVPVLGLFGKEDRNPSPEHVEQLTALMSQHGKHFEPHSFDEAGHGFLNHDRPSSRPVAAAQAWPLVDEFFARYLS